MLNLIWKGHHSRVLQSARLFTMASIVLPTAAARIKTIENSSVPS